MKVDERGLWVFFWSVSAKEEGGAEQKVSKDRKRERGRRGEEIFFCGLRTNLEEDEGRRKRNAQFEPASSAPPPPPVPHTLPPPHKACETTPKYSVSPSEDPQRPLGRRGRIFRVGLRRR